jgi:predicted component of type VI protein secretion system
MPAQLVALSEGPNILLDKPIMLFGRHPECDIQIDSRKISRRHCCVAQVADYLVVRDLGSTNGIRVNGVRVLEGKLRHGDELMIGNQRYQVRWEEQAAARPGRPRPGPLVPPADDDLLEQCDEPVPLEEASGVKVSRPAAGPPKPAPPPGELHPPSGDLDPLILPENLELAPASDVIPPDPNKRNRSP